LQVGEGVRHDLALVGVSDVIRASCSAYSRLIINLTCSPHQTRQENLTTT
jgi:hypothetical protein